MKSFTHNNKPYLYLLPALIFVFLFVGYGLVMALFESLNVGGVWIWEHYQRLVEHQFFWNSLWFSLKVAMISTVISLIIGILVTRLLYRLFKNTKWKLVVWVPMLIPHFVAGYIILLLFAPSGWFSSLFYQLQFIQDPSQFPILVMDRNGIGIILTYIWKEVPFVILMLLPVYFQLDHGYEEVVHTLGGGSWQVFWTVEWRWLFPVVVETGIILFAFIIAAFEVPALLGSTYPKMLPVLSYQWFFEGDWSLRPMAFASMLVLTGIILIFTFLALHLSQKMRFRMMKGRS